MSWRPSAAPPAPPCTNCGTPPAGGWRSSTCTAPNGTLAITSSGQGSVADNEGGGFEIYRASKAALNQLMRSYAARHHDDGRTLLLMAPGWVKTELGGSHARFTIGESIPHLVTTVDAQHGRTGLRYLDRHGRTVAW
ncbi:SDR family NAD(P)-dependent oxidoreductase [Streptomyces sp. CB02959]|uniref:SDR family NAD(P)-dependent oxidoreductase n=1 Tax=Streptomyces sp. CB02959 TaxID=2020330 RepID=UPI0027E437EE|nr:SDR family NAD(P)-dependent oxidoreductase [Streptomyces sp. CB02959]